MQSALTRVNILPPDCALNSAVANAANRQPTRK